MEQTKNFTSPYRNRLPAAGPGFAAASFASDLLECCPAMLRPSADSSGSCSFWRSARLPDRGACPRVVSDLPPVPVEIFARIAGSHRILFQMAVQPIFPDCPRIYRTRFLFAAPAQNPAPKIYRQTAGPDPPCHFYRRMGPAAVRHPAGIDPGIVRSAAPFAFAGPGWQAPGCSVHPRWTGPGQLPVCNAWPPT